MFKKIFISIIIINAVLLIWQPVLSISLSTKGDILSTRQLTIEQLKNQIDLIDNQIVQADSLEKVHRIALEKGFVPIKIINYSDANLAHVWKN